MRLRHLVVLVAAVFFLSISIAATAQERVPLRRAPQFVQEAAMQTLREAGIRPNNAMVYGISKDDCPSDCNDSIGGGYCFCDRDDNGECPGESEKVPTEENRCRVKPDSVQLSGGGLAEPLEVLFR